jgi:outer membrane protein assembly factor BamB
VTRSLAGLVCVCIVACSSGGGSVGSSARRSTPTPSPPISAEWTEYHRDAGRSGLGPSEPGLAGPKVAWNVAVDGDVYASPLIVNGHVIVATENNTVYSLDMFTGAVIWTRHLGDPVDAGSLPCGNIRPWSGITGTPAVDPSSGRLYVVAYLAGRHHVLFALSLVNGSVVFQQDIDPAGSNPSVEQLRGALAIGSGFVYVPFGGLFGDCGAYRGYVVAVPLAGGVARAFVVPAARGAGIWAPAGVSIGPDGSVYVVTGNATGGSGFGYSNSVLQLSPDLSSVRSYFAPSNWAALDASDTDLGSTGVALLPSLGRAVVVGKGGVAYLLVLGALGGIGGQIDARRVCAGAWGGTAWLGSTVFVPCADGLFALGVSASSISINWFVGRPTLASPIISAGALWAIDSGSATLYALDPADGRRVLFQVGLGSAQHFSTPAATDGFVVAPAGQRVVAVSVVGS